MTTRLSDTAGGARSAAALAALLVAAGATHLLAPRVYDGLIPSLLGRPRPWVIGSGLAELACGVAVAVPGTRRRGALAAAALLVAVFPGNVVMALRSMPGDPAAAHRPALAWGRLPLQVPLVLWALGVAGCPPQPRWRSVVGLFCSAMGVACR